MVRRRYDVSRQRQVHLIDMKALRSALVKLTDCEQRRFWATVFNIVGPEWMIILALAESDGCCADSAVISNALTVDQSFVYAHARKLEKHGHIRCARRGGSTNLSLTSATVAKLATLLPSGKT
jgi:DNA-binding MarR family transcriptional regulator